MLPKKRPGISQVSQSDNNVKTILDIKIIYNTVKLFRIFFFQRQPFKQCFTLLKFLITTVAK